MEFESPDPAAAETGLQVTVCHSPPGCRSGTKVEHRLFSHISMNWRGRPLVSHEVILELDRCDPDPHGPCGSRQGWSDAATRLSCVDPLTGSSSPSVESSLAALWSGESSMR